MNRRTGLLLVSAILFFASADFSLGQQNATVQKSNSVDDVRILLQKISGFSPDPCGPPYGVFQNSSDIESLIFRKATDSVTEALNATLADPKSPPERAEKSLMALRKLSAEINASWPEENRFQFKILDIAPALVVKLSIRTREGFFVFGVPAEDSGKPNCNWRIVGSDDESDGDPIPSTSLELYPLRRGASGNARFLAKFIPSGCAGSVGVYYDAREWAPGGLGSFDQIIKLKGAFGLDDKVPGFPEIGELHTQGALITLPYCWFSAIDTWDNPSLCAVDTYDVSGDSVKFQKRTYNRPDLLPIAKALEYAAQRDFPAVLAYCATAQVARSLVREIPPSVLADELHVTRTGNGRERVEFGSESEYRFDVAKSNGRWLIVGFSKK
jgi:hypothetical protein